MFQSGESETHHLQTGLPTLPSRGARNPNRRHRWMGSVPMAPQHGTRRDPREPVIREGRSKRPYG
jgi:hypothetical protein